MNNWNVVRGRVLARFVVIFALILPLAAWAVTTAGYEDFGDTSGVVLWRGTEAQFHESTVIDVAEDGTPGEPYAMTADQSATSWQRFASNQAAYASPGKVLVYDTPGTGDGYKYNPNCTFGPLSFGGMWVKTLAINGQPFSIVGSGDRKTEFGAAGESTLFKFDASYTIDRTGTTTFYGDATVEIAQDATFTAQANSSYPVAVDSAATLKLKGAGALAVTTMNVAGALDLSATTVPSIAGNVTLAGNATIVVPAGTALNETISLEVCSGTLLTSGIVYIKVGDGEPFPAELTVSGGTITEIDTEIQLEQTFTSGYPSVVPAGFTYKYEGGETAENTVLVPAVTVNGTLKTSGYIAITNLAVASSASLEVLDGNTTVGCASIRQIEGNITIVAGATLTNTTTDSLDYYGTMTVDVYGTLAMGNTRWSISGPGNNKFNLRAGARVTGAGDENGVLDLIRNYDNGGNGIDVYGAADNAAGAVTIEGPVRIRRDLTRFWIAENTTLVLAGGIQDGGGFSASLNQVGPGTLEIHDNNVGLGGGHSIFTQGTLRLVDTTLAFPVEMQNSNSCLEIVATDADTTVPIEIYCIDDYHNNNISFSGEGKVSGSITKKQAPDGTLAQFLQSEHWTGTLKMDWNPGSGSFDIGDYGNSNSVIEVVTSFSPYPTQSNGQTAADVASGIRLSADWEVTNGWTDRTTTFAKLSGSGTLTVTGSNGGSGNAIPYSITCLEDFTGTLAGARGQFTIGTIVVAERPTPGTKLVNCTTANAPVLDGTKVLYNGEKQDVVLAFIKDDGIYVASESVYSTYSTDEAVTSSSAGNANIDWQSFKLNADDWIYCTSEDNIATNASDVALDSVTVYWGNGTHQNADLGIDSGTQPDSYIVLTTTNDVIVGISGTNDVKWTANGNSTYTFEGVTVSPDETYRIRFVTSISGISVGGTLSSSATARVTCVWHGPSQSSAEGDDFVRTSEAKTFSAKCDISVSSLATIKLVDGVATLADTPYNDGLGSNSAGRYRIPAIAKSSNGVVVALYDCRYYNSSDLGNHDNVKIDSAENWSGDNGQTWTLPRIGIDVPNTSAYDKSCNFGDPCILFDPAGNKFWAMGITGGGLAYPRDSNGNSISDVALYTRGTGVNDTWEPWTGGPEGNERSVKQIILDALVAVDSTATSNENSIRGILQGPGHGMVQQKTVTNEFGEVIMPAGALVFPMQYFASLSNFNDAMTFAVYSTDGGTTWKSTKLTQADQNAQENCVMELDDGSWYMICKGRTNSDKKRQLFRTTNYEDWTYCGSLTPSEWVQGSCLRLGQGADGKGRYVACFSPSGRSNITLHFGSDTTAAAPDGNGIEWNYIASTNIYPYWTGGMGYNSLVMLDDTTLGVLLETNGHIELLAVDVSDIVVPGTEPDAEPVAKIGDTYYETVQDAIAAYVEGDVIELIATPAETKVFNRTGTFKFKIDMTYQEWFMSVGCASGYKFDGTMGYDYTTVWWTVVADSGVAKVTHTDGTYQWYSSVETAFGNAAEGDSMLINLSGDLAVTADFGVLPVLDTITFEKQTDDPVTVTTFFRSSATVVYSMAASNWVAPDNVTLKLYTQTVTSIAAGTVEIPEGATVTLGAANAFDSVGTLIGPGTVSLTEALPSGNLAALLQNPAWNGTFVLGAVNASNSTEVSLQTYGNENSALTLMGVSGNAWCASSDFTVNATITLDGDVNFQNGYSGRNVTFRKIAAGSGNLSLKTWDGCTGITYGFTTLDADNYTGTIQLDGTRGKSDSTGLIFNVGDILKTGAKRGDKILNITTNGVVKVNLDNATLNGEEVDLELLADGIYIVVPEPVFDPENDVITHECVLRISEIMPKPTDAQNRGMLEGMDVNGLESGWVEVENTSTTEWADLADYRFIRVNRGKKTDPAGYGNFPTRYVAPGGRAVFYTSERYSNSKDKAVSAFAEGTFDGKPMIFAEYGDILVWGDKVNPKKSPYVRLYYAPGGDSDKGTVVDTVVVPSDLPEGWSIIVGDAEDGEGTRRWMCPTPTRGATNTATAGLMRIGPNVGPLYEKKGQKKTDLANEFAAIVPPAVPGTDYTVTLPINGVMNPDGTFTPREADQIQSIKFVYRKDLDDSTLVTNDVDMATKATDENWGDQYSATIPASYFPAAGHLMQWKVLITDGEGVEWTSPSFNNKDDGYEWYGTIVEPDPTTQMSATLPTWHMFASGNHLTQMDVDKDDQNLSLVPNYARIAIYDSSTSNYYDYVRIDLRGNTSADFTKKGHGLRFAKAHPLTMVDSVTGEEIEEIRKTSLISEFADPSYMRQMIAFWLWRKMGNLVPFDFPVRCNLNGEFYQLAFNSERFTDELIEDVYGLDKFGYGYKNVGTMKSGSSTTAGGIEKKTPDDEDESNITVLQNELRAKITAAQNVSSSPDGGDTGLDNAALTKFVVQKFDLPAWLNYLASARITQEMDDVWANVCAYYDNPDMLDGARGKGTWMPLGYDFNLTFGQHYLDGGMSASGLRAQDDWFKCHPFYGGNRVRCYSSSAMSLTINSGNDGFEAVWQSAKFRRLYLRRLRTLMDQELKEPGTPESEVSFMVKMREMADLMRADSQLDLAKWSNDNSDNAIDIWPTGERPVDMDAGITEIWDDYVVPRRQHLYVTHSVTNTAKAIGYGSNLNAGIPEAQSPIETLAPNISISNLTALDAEQAEALGVDGQLYDTEVVVIRNDNDEAVDMSGWRLAFSVDFTFPAGTVCDANDSIYIVADRRTYIAAHNAELTDQVIVGNATFTGAGPIALYSADGTVVYSAIPQTNELKYLRLHSFYGNTLNGGDTNEWFVLTNISDSVKLDLADVTVCFLKQDDPESKAHCHITLENKKGSGDLAAGSSMRFAQTNWTEKGWSKIQNNKLDIKIYDKYGSVCQSLKVKQSDYPFADGNGGYLVCDYDEDGNVVSWHQEPKFTVTFSAGEHGMLVGEATQTVDWKQLAEVPNVLADETSEFIGWDGDVTEPVTNDVAFAAQYLDYGREPVSANEMTRLNGKVFTGNDANRAVMTNYLSQIDGTRPATPPAPHTIDVLLVYDSAATDYVANTVGESLEVHGAKGVAKMNEFLIPTDMDTNFWFRLVGTYSINAEGTIENGFGNAKNSSAPGWECVNDVRERLGADVVLTVVGTTTTGKGGLSWRNYPDWIRNGSAKAYSYASVLCSYRDTMAWVHEVGHLASLYHSVSETYNDESRYIGCGFGGKTAEDGTTFGSVMGGPYGSVGFSSPNHLFHGSVYSITNDVGQWLDSTGCLNELMPYIANYCETKVPEKPGLKIYPHSGAVVTNGMVMTFRYDDPESEIHVVNHADYSESIFTGEDAYEVPITLALAAQYDFAAIKNGETNDSQMVFYVSTNIHNIAEILDCGDMVWSTTNIWGASSDENNPKNGTCYKWVPGSETLRLTGTVTLDEPKTLVFHHIDEFADGASFIVWVDDRPAYYEKGAKNSNGQWEESTILLDSGFHTIEFEFSGNGSTLYLDDVSLAAFTVTFQPGEHGEITGETVQRVPYGEGATAPEVTPNSNWRFSGWDGDTSAPVTNDVIFTAQYSPIEYAIIWKLDEETVIDTTQVAYGAVPTHADAAKDPTAQYSYTFTGWTPEVVAVTGDATYTAMFSSTVNKYTATVTVPANTAITVKNGDETLDPDDGTTNEFTVDYGTVLTVEYEAVGAYVAGGVKTQSVTVNGTETVGQPEGYTNVPAVAQLMPVEAYGTYFATVEAGLQSLLPVMSNDGVYLQIIDDGVQTPNEYVIVGIGYDAATRRYAKAVAAVGGAGYLTVQEALDVVADGGTVILKADSDEELTLANGKTVTVHARQGETIFAYNAPVAEEGTYTVEAGETVNGETTYTARNWYSWTVTVDAENATVSGFPATVSESNPAISFTVTPDTGYEVQSVTVGGVEVEAVAGVYGATLDGDTTVTVQCSAIVYAINYIGTMDVDNTVNPVTYTVEDEVTLQPLADVTGWVFAGWTPASIPRGTTGDFAVSANWERQKFDVTVNGETMQCDYETVVTFPAPGPTNIADGVQIVYLGTTYTKPVVTNEVTVTITGPTSFEWDIQATNYWFATSDTQNGTITAPAEGWMADGTNFTLTAQPANHYHLVSWTGDTNGCEVVDGCLYVTMDQPRTIGATFAIDQFILKCDSGDHGIFYDEWSEYPEFLAVATHVNYGTTNHRYFDPWPFYAEIRPDAGYEFVGWDGDTSAPIISDTTFTALYNPISYEINYNNVKAAVNNNPTTYTIESEEIVFEPLANVEGWNFIGWDPASIPAGSTGGKTITAQWERPTFECTINGKTKTYKYGDTETFSAPEPTVDELCRTQLVYVGTTFTAPDVTNEFTVTITGPVSFDWDILATNYLFEVSDTANGSITAPEGGWMPSGTNFTLTAVADDHYHFVGWYGDTNGCEVVESGLSVTMDQPRTIGAIFEEDPLTIGEAVEAPELNWETSGDAEWVAERTESAPTGTAARSGAVGAGERSILSLALDGVGTLSFDWRTSCREKTDSVYLEVDGAFKCMLSGDTAWTNVVVNLGLGEHTVCWVYARGRGESAYDDAAWIDNVTWTPTPEPTLAEALGDFEWETGGDAESGWRAEYSEYSYNGNARAIADGLGDNVSAIIGTSVGGAGRLEFAWGVSCEYYYDKFLFYVDGEVKAFITGETANWEEVTIDLGEGDHVLEWEYLKDEMDDPELVGANCALLDYVRWTPAAEVPPETNDANLTAFFEWLKEHHQLETDNIEEAANIMNTSRKAAGRSYTLYAEYVTGTNPEDPDNEEFTANIEIVDGEPKVTFSPDTPELRATRTYTTLGKETLGDAEWRDIEKEEGVYHFFKVEVELKK